MLIEFGSVGIARNIEERAFQQSNQILLSLTFAQMATKYPKSAQTGESGVALIGKIVTDAGAIFRSFEKADIGIDGAIELLTPAREPSGDIVLVQIKAGNSYIRKGRFFVDADKDHFETWSRYALPVAGLVCDPVTGEVRWIDISEHLRQHPEAIADGPYSIEAPQKQSFTEVTFSAFESHFRPRKPGATQIHVTPNLLIRPWSPEDIKPTRALLSTIALDYPGFDGWLNKKFEDPTSSKKVVVVGNVIAAFSMWQAKDDRNVKLQTFIVGPAYRGTAIGQHLLYHEIRTWAGDPKIDRVHVTVASSKAELIGYFRTFGFRVEGFSPCRYPRPAAELIMAKHFLRSVVHTPNSLKRLAGKLKRQVWGLTGTPDSRFSVKAEDLAVPADLPSVTMTVNLSSATVSPRIVLKDDRSRELRRYDDESLMREFYPLRLHLAAKRYVVVPIYPLWADAMLSTSGAHSPLKLRIDNAYYCYPKLSKLSAGDLVLFYETKKGGGKGGAIGSAIVQEVEIDVPGILFQRFSDLGIYTLSEIEDHKNRQGFAMAIKFSIFEPFPKPVILKDIQQLSGQKYTFQGLTPILCEVFEMIRSQGLA